MASAQAQPVVRIARVDAETVRPLRQSVLRPGRPADEVTYAADPDAAHFAALDATGSIVGVATVFPQPHPDTGEAGWRLRGMAVAESARGTGCGARLLTATMAHAASLGGRLMWFNARVGALAFYERYGFTADTDVFDVPGGGPHRRMRQELSS